MPVDPVIRGIMDLIDAHSQTMQDQTYRHLSDHLMKQSCSMEHKEKDAKRKLATQMIVEEPRCIGTGAVYKYTHDPEFMKLVVRAKALELREYSQPSAAILGTEWKQRLAAALLEYDLEHDSPAFLLRLRLGVHSLLTARSQFLEQIVDRLDALRVTPQMLCPRELGVARLEGRRRRGAGRPRVPAPRAALAALAAGPRRALAVARRRHRRDAAPPQAAAHPPRQPGGRRQSVDQRAVQLRRVPGRGHPVAARARRRLAHAIRVRPIGGGVGAAQPAGDAAVVAAPLAAPVAAAGLGRVGADVQPPISQGLNRSRGTPTPVGVGGGLGWRGGEGPGCA